MIWTFDLVSSGGRASYQIKAETKEEAVAKARKKWGSMWTLRKDKLRDRK